MKFHDKIAGAGPASFHVLDPEKSKRMGGVKTLYIPSMADVRREIEAIPAGEMVTIPQLRKRLAVQGNADTACPAVTLKYWKWMAHAAELEGGEPLPWWRVSKDGKASDQLPGGPEEHRRRLAAEGVSIR